MPSPDVIVVGGGLIGLSAARELHNRGLRVTLLEKGRVGREASWAGAGMLAASAFPPGHPLRPLALASVALYPQFVARLQAETEIDIDLGRGGTLALTSHEWGTTISRAAAQRMVPGLAPEAFEGETTATFLPDDQYVDNRQLVTALRRALELRGIVIEEGCAVTRIMTAGGVSRLETGGGVRSAGQILITAGAWSGEIGGLDGVCPVRPRKGQMLAFDTKSCLPCVVIGREIYLVPRRDGRVLAGATLEDVGFDRHVQPGDIAMLRDRAMRVLPALAAAKVEETWAGFRPATPDALPLLGPVPGADVWLATGHFRDGILLTPVTAGVMADLMTGVVPQMELASFRPERFAGAP